MKTIFEIKVVLVTKGKFETDEVEDCVTELLNTDVFSVDAIDTIKKSVTGIKPRVLLRNKR